jgi:hypothetical protein
MRGLLLLASMVGLGLACPAPPAPSPNRPDASDAAPIVNREPGPVPAGNPKKCAAAASHADDICPGALSATERACARAGGADAKLIPCLMAASRCSDLSECDKPASASGGAPKHGR